MQTENTTTGPGSTSAQSGRPGIVDSAREAARREMDDARERVSGAADRARSEARHARSSVSRIVMDEMDKRKDELCDNLHGLAQSMRKGAEEAERRDDAPTPPRLIHQAIDTLDDLADRMRHRSTEDLTGAVSRFGRENPALFVAGALFAGLALGRFLVSSSSPRHQSDEWDEDRRRMGSGSGTRGDFGRTGSGHAASNYGGQGFGTGSARGGQDFGDRSRFGQGAQGQAGMGRTGSGYRGADELPSGTGVAGTAAGAGNPSGQGTGTRGSGTGAFAASDGSSMASAGTGSAAGRMGEGEARNLGSGSTSATGGSSSPDFDKMKRGVGQAGTTEDKDGSA
ncbi:hypothetical protein [Rhodobacter sp. CZR27]|uniref:hypothetical protein n=1 Tax=Rhodobacter sp. CZR27 TaxID=2033869 RepID=UPI001E47BEF6|nr:hypothetical protein [Rhodobacter sp. CZR27]